MSFAKKRSIIEWDIAAEKCKKSDCSGRQTKNEDPLESIWLANLQNSFVHGNIKKKTTCWRKTNIWDNMYVYMTEDSK